MLAAKTEEVVMAENRGRSNDSQRQMIVPRNMGKNMHRLKSQESFTDFVIETRDGKQLPVHKAALASASDYFATMFSIEMQEKFSKSVEMKNMSSDVLELVINFIYDQPIFFIEETVEQLTDAAEYLQVADLKIECQKFLLASTKPSNCLKHRFHGERYNMKAVTAKADEVIAGNFEDITKMKEFKELDYDDLQTMLQAQLKTKSEEIVFLAIVKWVKHDMDGRQNYFDSLFLSIDISLLTSEFIETEILNEILVNKTKFSMLRVSRELMSRSKLEKLCDSCRICIIGGETTVNDVVFFYPVAKETHHLQQLKFDLKYPHVVRSGDILNVIDESTSKIISLNLKDRKFECKDVTTIPPPKRYYFGCAVLNGFLYIAGGGSDCTYLSSVIKYDLSNNMWLDVKSMNEGRWWHSLVSLEGTLYAIGGHNRKSLRTVEMYDEDNNEWTYVSSLNVERERFTASVHNGRIYTTGGYSGKNLNSVEMYVPDEDVWKLLKEMNEPRRSHGSCVVGDNIYVVGGYEVTSIEVYDPDKDEWKNCGKLEKERNFCAVCEM